MTNDLKLLIDVAWANRDGQVTYNLASGEYAAADRLVKHGLLLNGGNGRIGITDAGERLVARFCDQVRRGGIRAVKEQK